MPSLLCWFSAAKTLSLWDSEWHSLWPVSISWILQKRAIVSTCFFSHQPLLSLVPPHSFSTCVRSADRSTLQECDLCDSVSLLSTIPLLSFSLIFSFPHPFRVSFSFLPVLLFLDLCFCVCPSVCVWSMSVDQWASDSGLCPLNTCTSLSAKLSLDVYLYVCIYVTLSPLWPPSWVSDSFSSSVPLCGGGASSEHDHHPALI